MMTHKYMCHCTFRKCKWLMRWFLLSAVVQPGGCLNQMKMFLTILLCSSWCCSPAGCEHGLIYWQNRVKKLKKSITEAPITALGPLPFTGLSPRAQQRETEWSVSASAGLIPAGGGGCENCCLSEQAERWQADQCFIVQGRQDSHRVSLAVKITSNAHTHTHTLHLFYMLSPTLVFGHQKDKTKHEWP